MLNLTVIVDVVKPNCLHMLVTVEYQY